LGLSVSVIAVPGEDSFAAQEWTVVHHEYRSAPYVIYRNMCIARLLQVDQ